MRRWWRHQHCGRCRSAGGDATCSNTACSNTTCSNTACSNTTCSDAACSNTTCSDATCSNTTCSNTTCSNTAPHTRCDKLRRAVRLQPWSCAGHPEGRPGLANGHELRHHRQCRPRAQRDVQPGTTGLAQGRCQRHRDQHNLIFPPARPHGFMRVNSINNRISRGAS